MIHTNRKVALDLTPVVILLLVALTALKLLDVLNWSWFWVLSPLWIPFAIVLVLWAMFLVFVVGVMLAAFLAKAFDR